LNTKQQPQNSISSREKLKQKIFSQQSSRQKQTFKKQMADICFDQKNNKNKMDFITRKQPDEEELTKSQKNNRKRRIKNKIKKENNKLQSEEENNKLQSEEC
jgi:hypothetical protein